LAFYFSETEEKKTQKKKNTKKKNLQRKNMQRREGAYLFSNRKIKS
jgi:hypothetical protein